MKRTYQFLVLSVTALLAVTISAGSSFGQSSNGLLGQMNSQTNSIERLVEKAVVLEKDLLQEQAGLNRQNKINLITTKLNNTISSMNGPISSLVSSASSYGNPVILQAANDLAFLYATLQSGGSSSLSGSTGSGSTFTTYNTMSLVLSGTIRREIQIQR